MSAMGKFVDILYYRKNFSIDISLVIFEILQSKNSTKSKWSVVY